MTGGLQVARLFGFDLRLDFSWLVLFCLVLWTFAQTVFPQRAPGLSPVVYVAMGWAGAVLLFVSVLLHELAHSAVARARGIPVEGITLFIFGGMTRIRSEATNPKDEFVITVVGPLSSAAIGLVLLASARLAAAVGLGDPSIQVLKWLALLNFFLAGFNLIPGFPLDGGRLLRSLVWKVTRDAHRATTWASVSGRGFGLLMIVLGLVGLFKGLLVPGIWSVFIGWFIAHAADVSHRQLELRAILEGVATREAMTRNPESVTPDLPLRDLVDDYFLRHRYGAYPVRDQDGKVLGLITLSQVKDVERRGWPVTTVREVMRPLSDAATVTEGDSLAELLAKLERAGLGRALVLDSGGRLVGLVSRSDLATWLDRYQQLH